MRIFVSNLPFEFTGEQLREVFTGHYPAEGEVLDAMVVADKATGAGRGFGFVEMAPAAAERALKELSGMTVHGRLIRLEEAHAPGPKRPRQEKRSQDRVRFERRG